MSNKVNKPFLQDFAKAIRTDPIKADKSFYGVVKEIVEDESGKVKGYKISLGGEDDVIECRKFAGADIGDTVMVTLMANGTAVVTGRRDGDGDAADAKNAVNHVAEDLSSNYSTTNEMNRAIEEAIENIPPPVVEEKYQIVEYAKSTSQTTKPTSGWGLNVPSLDATYKYLWTRVVEVEGDTKIVVVDSEQVSTTMSGTFTFLDAAVNSTGTTIKGSAIYGGTITLGGSNNVNGQLTVKNASNVVTTQLNNSGLYSIAGTIGGWHISDTMLSNGTVGTDNYIALSSDIGIRLGVDAFVFNKLDGSLIINAKKIDVEATNTIESVLTVRGTEVIPDEDDPRFTLTLDCTTEFNNSGYKINYEHTEKFNSTTNRIVTAETVMAGEFFSIDSSEADYQHSYGENASLLLSADGLQFERTFYADARHSEWESQMGCSLQFSGLLFTNYPNDTSNYDARLRLNDSGNMELTGTGYNGSTYTKPHIIAKGCYEKTQSGSTLTVNSNGDIKRSSSSRKLKKDITKDIETDISAMYDIDVVQFKYKDGVLAEEDEWNGKNIIGLIAEQVNEVFPEAVIHSGEKKENCDDWNPRIIIPAMLKLIQEQHEEIKSLKEKVVRLEA